jgi:gliding motility-associated-like protein
MNLNISLKKISKQLIAASILFTTASAQTAKWSADPFNQKVFVENNGQFDKNTDNPNIPVFFGVRSTGTEVYFTAKGICYKHDQVENMNEQEREAVIAQMPGYKPKDNVSEEENRKHFKKSIPHYLTMEWVGANPNTTVVTGVAVDQYFTYPKDASVNSATITAKAYKSIIYKNLYPNIDVEYVMPTDKDGIKYNLILHPGADVSKVMMQYNYSEAMFFDNEKNVVVQSAFGAFIDHAPITFYKDSKQPIKSKFEMNGNVVSFHLENYDNTKEVVVDPWTTNPNFPGFNNVYDVNYDQYGNVWAYGGGFPWTLSKLSATGVILWTYTAAAMYNSGCSTTACYGDCAIDEISGSCYLTEGFDWANGSRVFKIGTNGVQIVASAGNPNFNEIWRAEYNRCIGTIVGVGGGTTCCFQAILIDTNLVNMNPVNIYNSQQSALDQNLLSIDPVANFCYVAGVNNWNGPSNSFVKCPLPTLVPLQYNTVNGFNFNEVGSVPYVCNATSNTNGFNGLAASINWLYGYNGVTLNKYDKATGAQLLTVNTGGTMYQTGGTTVDICDNVYVGVGSTIKVYNPSLVQQSTIAATGPIYDLKMGPNNGKLYACGLGYVQELTVPLNNTVINTTSTPNQNCSNCNGTATTNITICGVPQNNVGYSWLPSNQTTQTATGLCAGLYTVIISTSCGVTYQDTITVAPSQSGGFTVTGTYTGSCLSSSATATATPNGGNGPYSYSWTTNPVQTTQTATGLQTGTYTCVVTDAAGCTGTVIVNINAAQGVTTTPNAQTNATCFNGCNGIADVTAANGQGPYTYQWMPGNQTTVQATGLCAGTYTCTTTDANGCTDTTVVTITQPTQLTVQSTGAITCNGQNANLTATPSGGTPNYIITWNPGNLNGPNVTVNPTTTTTYTITVTDANGCVSAPITVTVTVSPPLTLAASAPVSLCAGSNTNLTAAPNGGLGPYTYLWSPGNGTTSSITVTPTATTTYTVIVNDACNSSPDTANVTVTVNPLPTILFAPDDTAGCAPLCVNFTNSTTNSQTCAWIFGDNTTSTTCNPQRCYALPGTYNVGLTVTDNNGCSNQLLVNQLITVYPNPTADFSISNTNASILDPVICFTNLSTNATISSWNFGDPLALPADNNSTQTNPCHTYADTGSYCITLFVQNSNGCPDTIVYCLRVEEEVTFYAPNAFTPNGDGNNQTWLPQGIGIDPANYQLWIYDRWGNLIWETDQWGKGWPGTANGGTKIVQQDVYVWKAKFRDIKGKKHEYVGHISVVK